jgi:Asp-tRNA(Asn)/Glu-tRNA(Gln) amidotransferase A subunit family amidase
MEELTWLPALKIRELIKKTDLSPVEVTDHFLARIEEHDRTLGSVATLDVDGARRQARDAERARLNNEQLGPMHGIPIAIKELIDVAGLPVCGIGDRPRRVPTRDHIGIERLRRAGAVILGTTTVGGSPTVWWANADDWDGEVRNPWDTTRVAGASSAGSSVAAAARLVPVTIGSDGAGSTRLPPAFCGVAGIHPSRGRVPHIDYVTPELFLTQSIGPIARDVSDVALALNVMAGPDGRDLICMEDEPADYLVSLALGVEGLRFAWSDDFGYGAAVAREESPRVVSAVRDATARYASLGADVVPTDTVWENPFEGLGVAIQSSYPFATEGVKPTPQEYEASMEARARSIERFRALLEEHDLILSPTVQAIAPTVDDWKKAWEEVANSTPFMSASAFQSYYGLTAMFNWVGWPALTVPCGFVDNLPIGLQIIGRPGSEALILRAAHAFQVASPQMDRPLF